MLAASYEAKARGVRTAMGGRQARRLCPRRGRRPAAHVGLLRGEQGGVRGLRRHDAARRGPLDRRGVPRRPRDASGSRARRPRSPRGCAGDVLERVGLPITVGVARTKFLAKVASGVAKPDGLLVVPPRRRARVPPPAAGRAAVGRRPGDRAQAPRARDHDRRPGRAARRGGARLDARPRVGPAPARSGAQPRSPAGAGSAAGAGRSGRSARSAAAPRSSARGRRRRSSALVDRVTRRMRKAGRVGRTVVLRLRFDDFSRATRSHTLPHATAHTRHDPRDGAWHCSRQRDADDRARGPHARRRLGRATSTTTAPSSSRCRSTAAAARRSTPRWTRSGGASARRR